MTDILKFRFPGKEIQEKNGQFERIDGQSNIFGFVVTDFEGKNWLVFRENENAKSNHFHKGLEKKIIEVDFDQYLAQFQSLISKMNNGDLKKCVLSRIKKIGLINFNLDDYFEKLCAAYPNAFVYLLSSELIGTWIGATPEVFLKAEGNKGYTMSLAATKKNDDFHAWGEKELEEQKIVTEYLKSELENVAAEVQLSNPISYNAGPIKHLMTKIYFDFDRRNLGEFIKRIHPTPAVCGFPKKEAFEEIHQIEVHDRDLYSGILGWSGDSETELYVNLRCARFIDDQMFLFLGGGITKHSDPHAEWQETENKSRTLMDQVEFNQINR